MPSRAGYSTGIAALEAIVGREAALTIIRQCAGREILVRAIPHPKDEISILIGLDAAQAIADELLGDEDEGGRYFFINQPISFVQHTQSEEAPECDEAGAVPADKALVGIPGQIEALCGRDIALKIVAQYGGGSLFLPKRITDRSAIVQLVGGEVTQALINEFGAETYLNIPPSVYGSTVIRRELGMKMLRDGYTTSAVGRLLKVSRSTVFDWSHKIKEQQK